MKKIVTYKGAKVKIEFDKYNLTREDVSNQFRHGTQEFVINGKSYLTKWESKTAKSGRCNTVLIYEGHRFGDSEKKAIEFIIARSGL